MSIFYHYASELPQSPQNDPHHGFSTPLTPKPFPKIELITLNESLALEFGLDPKWLKSEEGLAFLAYGKRPDGKPPIAMAYAGHQFGAFVPSLGDGRAMLVGELRNKEGQYFDLHLKGSGRTPYSRQGDGKCTLSAAMREYMLSEAMHALNIPTTRALAIVTTGETIQRDPTTQEATQPGAVIARIGRSFIRVGTFQYFAAQGNITALKQCADFAIKRLCPEAAKAGNPYRALFEYVTEKQALLITKWLSVGFIHGVMNTDNCALSGETLDYGPAAFLDEYDPLKAFSFIDKGGRYSYGQQPQMGLWNLTRFAEAILPLLGRDQEEALEHAHNVLGGFDMLFSHYWLETFRKKLGLFEKDEDDIQLLEHWLETMHTGKADFTRTFRALSANKAVFHTNYSDVRSAIPQNKGHADLCRTDMMARLFKETHTPEERQKMMRSVNPRLIPRNHLIEKAISQGLKNDFWLFHHLNHAWQEPFSHIPTDSLLDMPPRESERLRFTYCGT